MLITPDTFTGAVAVLDVLGFVERAKSMTSLQAFHDLIGPLIAAGCDAESIINNDRSRAELRTELNFVHFADTLVLHVRPDAASQLGTPQRTVDSMIYASALVCAAAVRMGIPLRGAIAFGDVLVCHDPRCVLGNAVLEAHVVATRSDWSGVVLCDSATNVVAATANPRVVQWAVPQRDGASSSSLVVNWPAHSLPEAAGSNPNWDTCFPGTTPRAESLRRNTIAFYDAMVAKGSIGTAQIVPLPLMYRRSWESKYLRRRTTA